MTEVSTTLRSCYLAGPMRGIEDYNFPEFHKQAAWLRAGGWSVFSPAERDEEVDGFDPTKDVAKGLDYYMQYDIPAVCQADAVICLPDWEASQGARLETVTAVEVGHPVLEIVKGDGGSRMLMHVDPQYIREVFFAQGQGVDGPEVTFIDLGEETHVMSEEQMKGWVGLLSTTAAPEHDTEGETSWCSPRVETVDASAERKAQPIATGVLDYFSAALLEVSKVSKAGNDKHNPGQPLHHARGKSTDHADSLLRHLIDRGTVDPDTGQRHSAEVAWRALALLQQELEDAGAPLARGAVLPE